MTPATIHPEAAMLALALQSICAALSQPVQFSGTDGPGVAAVLRADAAFARKAAKDALATVALHAHEVRS